MKKFIALFVLAFLSGIDTSSAQFLKKLGKSVEDAAKRTVEDRADRETAKKTDQVLDSIFEANPEPNNKSSDKKPATNDERGESSNQSPREETSASAKSVDQSISVYSKFDFVPGDKVLFFDDFGADYIGDFPSRWNTNGTGEVVTVNGEPQKWFGMKSGHGVFYIPDVPALPEEYTIEFDLLAVGLDEKTASTTVLKIILSSDKTFNLGNYAFAQLPFCQYSPIAMRIRNNPGGINNEIAADIREPVKNRPHVSIAVNKQRFRLWINEQKYIDVPRLIPEGSRPDRLKFELLYFKDGKEQLLLSNLKVAEGGEDLRAKLIRDGSVSTNGIQFESGSAKLQPQSMGIIRQISQVLQQESAMKLRIVGHTDADGDEASNLELSTRRAAAVKEALVDLYQIDGSRLMTEGKGESQPVGDNNTADGKSQNRRVEFIKVQQL